MSECTGSRDELVQYGTAALNFILILTSALSNGSVEDIHMSVSRDKRVQHL